MESKILGRRDPDIYSFNIYGTIWSLIADNDEMESWIMNNFIQLRYVFEWDCYFFEGHHTLISECPGISHSEIPRILVKTKWEGSIQQLIKDSINNNLYVYLYADRFNLERTSEYNKEHLIHEVFIYGYDEEKQIFYLADNVQNGKYVCFTSKFDEIEKGYWAIGESDDYYTRVHLLEKRKKEDSKFPLNVEQIKLNLKYYLESIPAISKSFKNKSIFGMEAVAYTCKTIQEALEENKIIDDFDVRRFHLFYEHKSLMIKRLCYLDKHNLIQDGNYFIEEYRFLNKKYYSLRNLVLKYNYLADNNLLIRINENLKELIVRERNVLESMIDKIIL